ncbi:disulfide-isomerase SCO2-like protein [Drosera capensis]
MLPSHPSTIPSPSTPVFTILSPFSCPVHSPRILPRRRSHPSFSLPSARLSISRHGDAAAVVTPGGSGSRAVVVVGGNGKDLKGTSAKRREWSLDRESSLGDDSETHPDYGYAFPPRVSVRQVSDTDMSPPKKYRCFIECESGPDSLLDDCKRVVYEWTGPCRRCQGSGLVSYYSKRGKETITKCIPCLGVGYVHKITHREGIEVMENLSP